MMVREYTNSRCVYYGDGLVFMILSKKVLCASGLVLTKKKLNISAIIDRS